MIILILSMHVCVCVCCVQRGMDITVQCNYSPNRITYMTKYCVTVDTQLTWTYMVSRWSLVDPNCHKSIEPKTPFVGLGLVPNLQGNSLMSPCLDGKNWSVYVPGWKLFSQCAYVHPHLEGGYKY